MKEKPIAWMSPDGKVSQTEGKLFHIPLYTTPKPLSDEEIENMAFNFVYEDDELDIFAFARAIEERHGIK